MRGVRGRKAGSVAAVLVAVSFGLGGCGGGDATIVTDDGTVVIDQDDDGGSITIDAGSGPKRIGITRIHMEEDAGKSIHDLGAETLVDLNRCGVPLIEIVSEPDIRSPREAYLYLSRVRQLVTYLGICDGNMEEGSLRADANVSLRPAGSDELGTKTELKNMRNPFMGQTPKFVTECSASDGRVVGAIDLDKIIATPVGSAVATVKSDLVRTDAISEKIKIAITVCDKGGYPIKIEEIDF